MIKKILYAGFLLSVIAVCLWSVVLMYRSGDKYSVRIDPSMVTGSGWDANEIYSVEKSDLTVRLAVDGMVMPNNDSAKRVYTFLNTEQETASTDVVPNQILQKDDVIASVGKTVTKAENTLKCLSVEKQKEGLTITFLDYSRLYVGARIPASRLKYDLFQQSYQIKGDDISWDSELSFLDCVIADESLEARFQLQPDQYDILPGTPLTVLADLKVLKNVIVVPADFIIPINGQYDVQIVQNDAVQTRHVNIGEICDQMVEIKEGLSAGETLLLPNHTLSLSFALENADD